MIPARELAAHLTSSVLDHVERERNLVRHSIEDVICDRLMLEQAKAGAPTPIIGGAAGQEVHDAAKRLCSLMVNSSAYFRGVHPSVSNHIDALYGALLRTGWRP